MLVRAMPMVSLVAGTRKFGFVNHGFRIFGDSLKLLTQQG
jgi:hypothetical protein